MKLGLNHPHRSLNPVNPRLNPPHVSQRHRQADRPMPAHVQVADIIEKDHARRTSRVRRLTQQRPHHRVRSPRFIANRRPVVVKFVPEQFQPFPHCPAAQWRPSANHQPCGFSPGMRIDHVNSLRHQYNIALSIRKYDAIVVGAGIVGAACARELKQAGLSVVVLEASNVIGGGATAAGMGHLAVMDDSDAQFALTSYSQRLWANLAPELPADAELLPCGSLWVAADDEEMAEVHRKNAFYTQRGIPVEVLDPHQLAAAEPSLRPSLAGGLRMPADSVCYPPCAARYLLSGIPVQLNHPVTNLADLDGGIIVLATGTAVTRFIPWAPVAPRKGHLLITDRYPGFLTHQLIELGYLKSAHAVATDSVAFNAQPRATGQILIGSSRQFGTEDPAIEQHMLSRMLARALEYMPGLADLQGLRTWTGFRAATPDKVPLIGLCPGYDNLYLATGHEGLGISTSLATGRLIADEVMGRTSEIPREWYAPGRDFPHHD